MRVYICVLQTIVSSNSGDAERITCNNRQRHDNADHYYYSCIKEQSSCAYIRYFDVPKFYPERQQSIPSVKLEEQIQTTQTL